MKKREDLISILRAEAVDLEDILGLQRRAFFEEAELYGDQNIPPLTQTLGDLKAEFQEKVFLKAVDEGRLVGSVRVGLRDGTALIGRLMVEKAWRRRGVGTRLLAAAETVFREASACELFTGERSVANLRLYRNCGYTVLRRENRSCRLVMVYLRKPIG